jgi:hypothetical protein
MAYNFMNDQQEFYLPELYYLEFPILLYLCTESSGSRSCPDNLRSPWLWLSGIAASWAVQFSGLIWFSLGTYLPIDTFYPLDDF